MLKGKVVCYHNVYGLTTRFTNRIHITFIALYTLHNAFSL